MRLDKKLWALLLAIGPAFYGVGYTIGTGSVTAMTTAGSRYGMSLLWVLALSCLFSWVLMEAYGRFAIVTGDTAIHGFKTRFGAIGKPFAILTAVMIVLGQWTCLSGLVGLSANAVYEMVHLFMPSMSGSSYLFVLLLSLVMLTVMYGVIWKGSYSLFEKILVIFVSILGLSFIVSMFIVLPDAKTIASGFVPNIPDVPGSKMMIAAFVGTTMAGPTFIVRPLLMRGKGWTTEHIPHQSRDALTAAVLMFIINGAIMVVATGALHARGLAVERVLDMVNALEPFAGRYAAALFLVGTLSAGLSSVFPILLVAPLLASDYQGKGFEVKSRLARTLALVGCLFGLIVPVLGANPIAAQIATQISQVFVLPLVIVGILLMTNNTNFMGKYKAGWLLNTGMIFAFLFSCMISLTAVQAIYESLTRLN